MKNLKFILFLCFFLGVQMLTQAQDTDKSDIDKAIRNYFEGYMTGDMKKLVLAFDTTSAHLYAMKAEAGKSITTPHKLNEVVKRWVKNVEKKPYTEAEIKESYYKTLLLDITDGKVAMAKIEIKLGQKTYYDYLSLYKMNVGWRIVSKTFAQK